MAAANVVNTLIVPAASKVAPYYDDFDESKNFHRVMFRPGYAVQARELTQLQTILQNQIERFGRHIFVNGSSVIGGKLDLMDVTTLNVYPEYANTDVDITLFKNKTIRYSSGNNYVTARVVDTSLGSNTSPPAIHIKYLTGTEFGPGATIRTTDNLVTANLVPTSNVSSNGSLAFIYDSIYFMQGHFVKVPAHSVVVSKHIRNANVKVGLELSDDIITEQDDITLLDPALEASNYQAPGAGRYQLILNLATRSLDSTDDAKWIQIAKIQDGIVRELISTPIYSEIEEVMARRTYDESGNYIVRPFRLSVEDSGTDPSNNFTLVISSGKAYVYGYEVENQSETRIEIPRARTTNPVTNYNLNCNYGKYVIVDNLKGVFPIATMGAVDLHCVTSDLVDYSSSITYNSSKIGTARVRDISFYGGDANTATRKHEFYFFDNKFNNITDNSASTANTTDQIVLSSANSSSANDAYTGAYIRILSGNSSGDLRLITAYNGNNKRANVSIPFSANTNTSSRYQIQFDITDVDSFITDTRYSGTGATSNASASISLQSKDNGTFNGNTFIYDPQLSSTIFPLPENFIAPGLSDQSYVYRRVFTGVNFTGGNSSILTAGTDEDFVGSTSSSNTSSVSMDNFLVIVTSNTGSVRQLGEQIAVAPTVTTTTPEQATLFTGNTSDSFVATVYAKMNATETAAQPRVKTFVGANTTIFSPVGGVNFLGPTGSNTYVYLSSGQVAIKNPSSTDFESLYISDVINFSKIYTKETDPVAGEDLTQLVDVSNRYLIDRGHKTSYYDHAAIKLKPGFANPTGWIIVCLRYYSSTTDSGYFSVDSYPNIANNVIEEGQSLGTGYGLIPNIEGLRLADSIDFRPVRPNASNNEFFAFTSARVPVATSDFNCDYLHYLERRDIIALSLNDTISLIQGNPSITPYFPNQPERTLLLHRLSVLPYTIDKNSIIIENIDHRRYTMQDIAGIDRRVKNLEYTVTLNTLEKSAADISIKDADGLDRTKYGILADNFKSHLFGDAYNSDYICAVDIDGSFSPTGGILMPASIPYYDKLVANTATFQNISIHQDKVTLAYKVVPAISQGVATKSVTLSSYQFATFRGQIITSPENDRWKNMTYLPPEVITVPQPQVITIDRTVYVNNTVVVENNTPAPQPPPTTQVQRLMLDGPGGLSYNKTTKVWGNKNPNAGFQRDAQGRIQTVGMSDTTYLRLIQQEIGSSGFQVTNNFGGGTVVTGPPGTTLAVAGWVDDAYRTAVNRPGELPGLAFWNIQASVFGWNQAKVTQEITGGAIASGEAAALLNKTAGATYNLVPWRILQDNGTYKSTSGTSVVLGANYTINTPDATGFQSSTTPTGMTTGASGGNSFTPGSQVTTNNITLENWIKTGLYGNILNRQFDEGGYQYWRSVYLANPTVQTQQRIVNAFYISAEYQQGVASGRIVAASAAGLANGVTIVT